MAMEAHKIEALIKAGIPDAEVTIEDLVGDGNHYAASVISNAFDGKSRVLGFRVPRLGGVAPTNSV